MYKTFADLKTGDSVYVFKRQGNAELSTYKVIEVGKCAVIAKYGEWILSINKIKSPFVELEDEGHDFVFADINMMSAFYNGWFNENRVSQMLVTLHK